MGKTFLCLLTALTLILQQASIVYAMDEEDHDHSTNKSSQSNRIVIRSNSNKLDIEPRHFFESQQRKREEELRWEREEAHRRNFLQEPVRRIFIDIPQTIEMVPSEGKIVQTNGLKITIPKDSVSSTTPFSIKPAPLDIQLPEHITPITALYEVEPHNVRFHDLVDLTFTIPEDSKNTSGKIVLFIQKDDPQERQLKKWLVIEPKHVEDNTATFEVRSFSFPFVGKIDVKQEYDLLSGSSPSFKSHNIIRPGLNYRAYCEDKDCELNSDPLNKELMIINRGNNGKFLPNEEVDQSMLQCSKCKKSLNEYESIKQIFIFQAEGNITYRLNTKPRPPIQVSDFNAIGNKLITYGDIANSSSEYSSFIINVKPQKITGTNPNAAAVINFDVAGNPIGNMFDLGVDGAFQNIKLLIGKFYNGEGFTKISFENHVGNALNEKGFNWRCTEDEDDFLKSLPGYDVAWVIGAHPNWQFDPATGPLKMKNVTFPDEVITFHKSGKGIMLWEDNDPVGGSHTTETLKKLFGITVEGNDPGRKNMVAAANCSNNTTFSKSHPVSTGINSLYEGITICRPTSVPAPLKVLATSSANHPNIMYVDEHMTAANSGRVIIDCGFTKLYKEFWDTAGTARYVKNATCWLTGHPCDTM